MNSLPTSRESHRHGAESAGHQKGRLLQLWVACTVALLGLSFGTLLMALQTIRHMHVLETNNLCVQRDLSRLRFDNRSLLSARAHFPDLSERWRRGVTNFRRSFALLRADAASHDWILGDARYLQVAVESWQRLEPSLAQADAALTTISALPIAQRLGDHGLQGCIDMLLRQEGRQVELDALVGLRAPLMTFQHEADRFERAVIKLGQRVQQAALRAYNLALVSAVLLSAASLVGGTWLVLRIVYLNLGLEAEAASRLVNEQLARRRERHLRALLEQLTDGVITRDADGCISWYNSAAAVLCGVPVEEALGQPLEHILHLENRVGETITIEAVHGHRCLHHHRLLRTDGSALTIDLDLAPISGEDAGTMEQLVVLRDIGQRELMEQRLRQSEQLEAIGQLAGGIAHDFNNMLAGILGSADLLAVRCGQNPKLMPHIDVIIKASQRAAMLTRQLLDYARRSTMQTLRLDLHELIADSLQLLTRSLDRRIQIETDLLALHPAIDGDAAQLQNVFMNLALNARDAMPAGGILRIATRDKNVFRSDHHHLAPGRYIEIQVADTGHGIPAEALPRIFEPFFTTKEIGKGSGLGLAAVHGTIERHQGRIHVTSNATGTCFTILLPCSTAPSPTSEQTSPSTHAHTRQGHALVVDDEELVREMAAQMLRELGFTTTTANDGLEGRARFTDADESFDLALIDVVMPGLSGRDLFRECRQQRPELPIILCSGYTADAEIDELLEDAAALFLVKPFNIRTLSAAIDKVLSGHSGHSSRSLVAFTADTLAVDASTNAP